MVDSGRTAGRRARTSCVLIVNNREDELRILRDALEREGHQVVEAGNGQQALDLLVSENHPSVDVILLDLELPVPVLDGWQFLQLLGSYVSLRRIPVVILSSHELHYRPSHPAIAGSIRRPFAMQQLLELVNASVGD